MKYCSVCGRPAKDEVQMCDSCSSLSFQNKPVKKTYMETREKEDEIRFNPTRMDSVAISSIGKPEKGTYQAPGSYNIVLWEDPAELDKAYSSCLVRVFLRMFTGLLVTAIAALAVLASYALQAIVFNVFIFFMLLIGEIILVLIVSHMIDEISETAAKVLFYVYAAINGLTMASIFVIYDIGEIVSAFCVCALMFVIMAGYGATTKRDLSKAGNLCFMGLIGIIIASVLNIFIGSDWLGFIINYVGILVFVGLTAYDTRVIYEMLKTEPGQSREAVVKRISVTGALSLYLDFINLFLQILSLFGRKK